VAHLPVLHRLRSVGRPGRIVMLALAIAGVFVAVWLVAPSRYRLMAEGILALLILLVSCILIFPKLIAPPHPAASLQGIREDKDRIQFQDDRLKLQNDVRAALLQAIGGAALLIGLLFTWQQFQTNREQLNAQLDLTRQGQVAERFTHAIDQLGSDKLEIQLGGIYGLEQIARDSPDQRLVVFEVLTAYVRKHAPWPPRLPGQPAKDAPIKQVPELRGRAPDVQAALTVLGRRQADESDPTLDLRSVDLRKADLRNANLRGATLFETQLQDARLEKAQLQYALLFKVNLQDATLTDAQLQRVLGTLAQLQGADFLRANLQGAYLADANLQGARLSFARLQQAALYGANLQGAILGGEQLQGALADKRTRWPSGYDWRAAGIRMFS
jgi:Pentapeptide repeats (8 copies)